MSSIPVVAPPPWYRESWVWFVIFFPALAVVGCAITIVLAVRSADGVVSADYYKRGLAINEQLARAQQAAAIGLAAEVQYEGTAPGDAVRLTLTAEQAMAPEAVLRVRLVHPGRSGADRSALVARLAADADGRMQQYAGNWDDAGAVGEHVAWRLVVEGRQWRLDGDAAGSAAQTIQLTARRPAAAD